MSEFTSGAVARSELEMVLATLHGTASAMAADTRPPARIKLGAAGVTLEWDLVPSPAPSAPSRPASAERHSLEVGPSGSAVPDNGDGGVVAQPVTAQHTLTCLLYTSPSPRDS